MGILDGIGLALRANGGDDFVAVFEEDVEYAIVVSKDVMVVSAGEIAY